MYIIHNWFFRHLSFLGDLSTLYVSIPHTSLKDALTSLFSEAYKVRENIFQVIDNEGHGVVTTAYLYNHLQSLPLATKATCIY